MRTVFTKNVFEVGTRLKLSEGEHCAKISKFHFIALSVRVMRKVSELVRFRFASFFAFPYLKLLSKKFRLFC